MDSAKRGNVRDARTCFIWRFKLTEDQIKAAAERYQHELYKHTDAKDVERAIPYLAFQAGVNLARVEMESETKRYKALYEDYSREVDELKNERNALREQLKIAIDGLGSIVNLGTGNGGCAMVTSTKLRSIASSSLASISNWKSGVMIFVSTEH